jgi:hypothetical protein
MAIITSRPTETDQNVERLQEILEVASLGALGKSTDPQAIVHLEDTMEGLIEQTDTLFEGMLDTLELLGTDLLDTSFRLVQTQVDLDVAQDALANLIGGIDYDEALDHATADLMECFCASGSADVSADGELVFDERISFTKEDIKPMLREAIVRWVELKMGQ